MVLFLCVQFRILVQCLSLYAFFMSFLDVYTSKQQMSNAVLLVLKVAPLHRVLLYLFLFLRNQTIRPLTKYCGTRGHMLLYVNLMLLHFQ
jgi:hypothetical protein